MPLIYWTAGHASLSQLLWVEGRLGHLYIGIPEFRLFAQYLAAEYPPSSKFCLWVRAGHILEVHMENWELFQGFLAEANFFFFSPFLSLGWLLCAGTRPLARQKYSACGGFSAEAFIQLGVPEYLAQGLSSTSNFGLSQGSWKTYSTVRNHLKACSKDIGWGFVFPLGPKEVLTFLGWLINRGLKASSIQVYLSGLRTGVSICPKRKFLVVPVPQFLVVSSWKHWFFNWCYWKP